MVIRSENDGSFGYDLKNGGSVSQKVWNVKEPSLLKTVSGKYANVGQNLQPCNQLKNCSYGSKQTNKQNISSPIDVKIDSTVIITLSKC
jgi:hypothetical protein